MVDLDDTTRCPLAGQCITCDSTDDLAVATYGSPIGVFCLTFCDNCLFSNDHT